MTRAYAALGVNAFIGVCVSCCIDEEETASCWVGSFLEGESLLDWIGGLGASLEL